MDSNEEPNEIKVVTGDDSELEISTVYEHINLEKIRNKPDKNKIIIPEVQEKEEKKSD